MIFRAALWVGCPYKIALRTVCLVLVFVEQAVNSWCSLCYYSCCWAEELLKSTQEVTDCFNMKPISIISLLKYVKLELDTSYILQPLFK